METTELKLTKAQEAWLARIRESGFTVKEATTKIGDRLWVVAERLYIAEKCPNGNVFLDDSIYGCIGPRGGLELTYMPFGKTEKVTEAWRLRSILDEWKWRFPQSPYYAARWAKTETQPV